MSEFGEWLKEVDVLLGERVKRLFHTKPRSAAIELWANLSHFMNLYTLWQHGHDTQSAVAFIIAHADQPYSEAAIEFLTEHPSGGEQ